MGGLLAPSLVLTPELFNQIYEVNNSPKLTSLPAHIAKQFWQLKNNHLGNGPYQISLIQTTNNSGFQSSANTNKMRTLADTEIWQTIDELWQQHKSTQATTSANPTGLITKLPIHNWQGSWQPSWQNKQALSLLLKNPSSNQTQLYQFDTKSDQFNITPNMPSPAIKKLRQQAKLWQNFQRQHLDKLKMKFVISPDEIWTTHIAPVKEINSTTYNLDRYRTNNLDSSNQHTISGSTLVPGSDKQGELISLTSHITNTNINPGLDNQTKIIWVDRPFSLLDLVALPNIGGIITNQEIDGSLISKLKNIGIPVLKLRQTLPTPWLGKQINFSPTSANLSLANTHSQHYIKKTAAPVKIGIAIDKSLSTWQTDQLATQQPTNILAYWPNNIEKIDSSLITTPLPSVWKRVLRSTTNSNQSFIWQPPAPTNISVTELLTSPIWLQAVRNWQREIKNSTNGNVLIAIPNIRSDSDWHLASHVIGEKLALLASSPILFKQLESILTNMPQAIIYHVPNVWLSWHGLTWTNNNKILQEYPVNSQLMSHQIIRTHKQLARQNYQQQFWVYLHKADTNLIAATQSGGGGLFLPATQVDSFNGNL